jgi:hypothetical protein
MSTDTAKALQNVRNAIQNYNGTDVFDYDDPKNIDDLRKRLAAADEMVEAFILIEQALRHVIAPR